MVPLARVLVRVGFTADTITTLGLVLSTVGAALVASGRTIAGGWVLVAGALSDTFDGPVARLRGTSSTRGAFFDSVSDRVSDGLVFGAVAWTFRAQPLLFGVTLVALVAAQITSYVRAKGESLGVECTVGLVERGERAIIILAGLCFSFTSRHTLPAAVWLLAVGGVITVVQRYVHVQRELRLLPQVPPT